MHGMLRFSSLIPLLGLFLVLLVKWKRKEEEEITEVTAAEIAEKKKEDDYDFKKNVKRRTTTTSSYVLTEPTVAGTVSFGSPSATTPNSSYAASGGEETGGEASSDTVTSPNQGGQSQSQSQNLNQYYNSCDLNMKADMECAPLLADASSSSSSSSSIRRVVTVEIPPRSTCGDSQKTEEIENCGSIICRMSKSPAFWLAVFAQMSFMWVRQTFDYHALPYLQLAHPSRTQLTVAFAGAFNAGVVLSVILVNLWFTTANFISQRMAIVFGGSISTLAVMLLGLDALRLAHAQQSPATEVDFLDSIFGLSLRGFLLSLAGCGLGLGFYQPPSLIASKLGGGGGSTTNTNSSGNGNKGNNAISTVIGHMEGLASMFNAFLSAFFAQVMRKTESTTPSHILVYVLFAASLSTFFGSLCVWFYLRKLHRSIEEESITGIEQKL